MWTSCHCVTFRQWKSCVLHSVSTTCFSFRRAAHKTWLLRVLTLVNIVVGLIPPPHTHTLSTFLNCGNGLKLTLGVRRIRKGKRVTGQRSQVPLRRVSLFAGSNLFQCNREQERISAWRSTAARRRRAGEEVIREDGEQGEEQKGGEGGGGHGRQCGWMFGGEIGMMKNWD